jgi:acyl-coenzyme A synthetase/AMP-(fatty) acid ligase
MQEHPAVLAAGVVGIPHLETQNLTRALVVLKPGKRCTPVELCTFAAKKLPYLKQLHGGVKIVDNLPVNKGGKMDRRALKELALANDIKYQ